MAGPSSVRDETSRKLDSDQSLRSHHQIVPLVLSAPKVRNFICRTGGPESGRLGLDIRDGHDGFYLIKFRNSRRLSGVRGLIRRDPCIIDFNRQAS